MAEMADVRKTVHCVCGHDFEVLLAGQEMHLVHTCPSCGAVHTFDAEKVGPMVRDWRAATQALKSYADKLRAEITSAPK